MDLIVFQGGWVWGGEEGGIHLLDCVVSLSLQGDSISIMVSMETKALTKCIIIARGARSLCSARIPVLHIAQGTALCASGRLFWFWSFGRRCYSSAGLRPPPRALIREAHSHRVLYE